MPYFAQLFRSVLVPNESNSSLEFKPVVTNHIIDIKVPAVATATAKSLPPLSDTKFSAGESQEKLLQKKDECHPPPYSQIEETTLASSTNVPMAISSTSPSKAPHVHQISPQGLYGLLTSEEGVTTVVTAKGEGQQKQEIHYIAREARVEEKEEEGDSEGGEKYVLRGVGEYSLPVDRMGKEWLVTPYAAWDSKHNINLCVWFYTSMILIMMLYIQCRICASLCPHWDQEWGGLSGDRGQRRCDKGKMSP